MEAPHEPWVGRPGFSRPVPPKGGITSAAPGSIWVARREFAPDSRRVPLQLVFHAS